ncbi:MAG TPA: TetR/AcrR family transcriptional regulator [Terriglobales bacterium]|nr:TetR/AcrR family transcriptional regulator [Terriglobales bacterium]
MSTTVTPANSQVPLDRRATSGRLGKVAKESRFERRLAKILQHATDVFYEKGYEGASMRDLSRASGMSLAGMYYYFETKDRLLYLIQKHTFRTIVDRLKARLNGVYDPEQRVRILIQNHLEYFLSNQRAMKVLSHEDDVLTGEYGQEVATIKREYYRTCMALLDEYKQAKGLQFNSRMAVLSLFGMMNWIYTWYNPRIDADAHGMATEMGDLFLNGVGTATRKAGSRKKSAVLN